MFAIALYDNQAESEDELDFIKDDILEVIQFDYAGLEGWWLCKLKNNVGLAAGNRLKILNIKQKGYNVRDSNISTTSTISNISTKSSPIHNSQEPLKTPQKLSASEKSLNKSMNFITKSVENIISDCNKLKINDISLNNEDDDYEYDVPENNKPLYSVPSSSLLKRNPQVSTSYSDNELTKVTTNNDNTNNKDNLNPNSIKHASTSFYSNVSSTTTSPLISKNPIQTQSSTSSTTSSARKSNSPTIDSGISSSSLMSLNELLTQNSSSEQTVIASVQVPPLPKSKIPVNEINQIETRLNRIIKNIRETCKILFDISEYNSWREKINLEKKLKEIKISFFEIKTLLNEFYELILIIRNNYLFSNKVQYNELCLKLNEFIQKFNSNINILNTLNWDINILANNNKNRHNLNDELDENLLRLNYLIELIQMIQDCNYQYNVFNNNSSENNNTKTIELLPKVNKQQQKRGKTKTNQDYDYADNDDDEDDDIYENDDDEWLKMNEKSGSEQANNSQNNISINISDQMLIKFYSKHIDDNFNDIKLLYDLLNKNLNSNMNSSNEDCMMDLTNKLALCGHKLVFICDTLNRNLNNILLKNSLNNLSNNLCDCLKLYVIRIKTCYSNNTNLNDSKSNLLVVDSLGQVYNCALQLKQLIIKYL